MDEIYIIKEISGSGWDHCNVGYFQNKETAIKDLLKKLDEKGCVTHIDHTEAATIIDVMDKGYQLQYRIFCQPVDRLSL